MWIETILYDLVNVGPTHNICILPKTSVDIEGTRPDDEMAVVARFLFPNEDYYLIDTGTQEECQRVIEFIRDSLVEGDNCIRYQDIESARKS